MSLARFSLGRSRHRHRRHSGLKATASILAVAASSLGLVVAAAAPAAAFGSALIINSTGGTTTANGLKIHFGSGQFQVYRSGTGQVYGQTDNPGAATGSNIFNGIFLTVGSTVIGPRIAGVGTNTANNVEWDTITTTGAPPAGGSGTVLSTLTKTVAGKVYSIALTIDYTYPDDYFTISYAVTIPTGNTAAVKLYHAVDAFLGGSDAGPGFYQASPTTMVGTYSAPGAPGASALEAFRYRSGPTWTSYVESLYYCQFTAGCATGYVSNAGNYPNTVNPSPTNDSGYGINYNLGTTAGTTNIQNDWVFRENNAQLTKAFSASPIQAGGTSNVTFTITNSPDGVARTGLGFTDTLPAGLTVDSTGLIGNTCGGTVTDGTGGTLGASDPAIKVMGAVVPLGASSTCTVTVAVTTNTAGTYVNGRSNLVVSSPTLLSVAATNQTLTVTPKADLSISTTNPTIVPGATSLAVVTVSNSGPSTATAPVVTYTPPVGVTVVISALPATCSGSASGPITCTLTDVSASGTGTVNIPLTVPSGTASGTAFTGGTASVASSTFDPATTNNNTTADASATVWSADLVASATTPSIVPGGAAGVVVVGVTNNGPSDAVGTDLVYSPPTGATVDLAALPAGCAGTSATAPITCTVGSIVAGTSSTFSIPLLVPATATGTLTGGSVVASATTGDPASGNNTAPSSVTATPNADLTTSATTPSIVPGTSGTTTLTVANAGPSNATTLVGQYTPPAGVTVNVASLPAGCTGTTNGPISCALGAISSGSSASVIIPLHVAANAAELTTLSGGITNASSGAVDPNTVNTAGPASVDVAAASADLSTATSTPTITPGTSGNAIVTVTNSGPSDAQGPLTVDYTAPTGVTITSLPSGCTGPLTGTITCTLTGPLAATGSALLTVPLAVPAGATPGATLSGGLASSSSATADPALPNNDAASTVTVGSGSADLSVTASTPVITPGTSGVVTLTAHNNGPSNAASATVTYSLLAGTTVDVASLPVGCTGTTAGPITCVVPGPLSVGASVAFVIPVTVSSSASPTSSIVIGSATIASPTSDPSLANNTASSSTATDAAQSDLGVAINTPTIVPGTSGNASITITNNGPSDNAGPISVSYTPPTGTTVTSLPSGCTGALVGPITCVISGPVVNGGSQVILVPISLPANSVPGATLAGGSVSVSAPAVDPSSINNSAPSSLLVGPASADLAVTGSSPSLTPGTSGIATVAVTNNGPSDAAGPITVTYAPPAGVNIVSLPTGCTGAIPSGPISCVLAGPLANGGTASVPVPVAIPANAAPSTVFPGGSVSVASLGADPVAANNTGSTSATSLAASADVSVTMTNALLAPGTSGTATLAISNAGPSNAAGPITVGYTPPVGVEIVSLPSGCTGTLPAGPITCVVPGPLVPLATSSILIPVRLPLAAVPGTTLAGGSISATSPSPDPVGVNNNAPVTQLVSPAIADVEITSVTVPSLVPGGGGNVVIDVVSNGPSAAGDFAVVYTLPADITADTASSSWDAAHCLVASGVVTCTVPGPLAPTATRSITIPVVSALDKVGFTGGSVSLGGLTTIDPVLANNGPKAADPLQDLSHDTDGDGIIDALEFDTNHDRVVDDTDADGVADYRDLNSDGDGDGLPDSLERGSDATPRDTDGDGVPDFRDTDSDGDGVLDINESAKINGVFQDGDGDGIPDFLDPTPLFDLTIKVVSQVQAGVNQASTVDLDVMNIGGMTAPNTSFSFPLPTGIDFVSGVIIGSDLITRSAGAGRLSPKVAFNDPSVCSEVARVVTCQYGDLGPNTRAHFRLTFKATQRQTAPFVLDFHTRADGFETVTTNNNAVVPVTARSLPVTGTDVRNMLGLASVFAAIGAALALVGRRRRSARVS